MRGESLSGSCRGRRKENLYEGSWREFEPCARFITPITERRGGDPSLIYRDAQLEKAPTKPRIRVERSRARNAFIIIEEYRIVYHAAIRFEYSYHFTRKILYKLDHDNKVEIRKTILNYFKNSMIAKNLTDCFIRSSLSRPSLNTIFRIEMQEGTKQKIHRCTLYLLRRLTICRRLDMFQWYVNASTQTVGIPLSYRNNTRSPGIFARIKYSSD